MADVTPAPDAQAIAHVARIFKGAAHAIRLRALLALESGECDSRQICQLLSDYNPNYIHSQLQSLYEEGLAGRRTIGARAGYSLSNAGLGVVRSFHVISRQLGFDSTTPPEQNVRAGAAETEPTRTRQARPIESAYAIDAASLLNHGANPLRLRLLLTLSEGDRDPDELSHELGEIHRSSINQHLAILQSGTLITSHRSGRQHIYSLALNGLSLIQVVRATCSGLTIRRGELILRPSPIRAGEDGALDPTSPDGLACLLRAFAHPIRLRVLNVLVAAGEICSCHLPEILQLPKRLIFESMAYARKTELVLDRHEHRWVFLRPSPSASDLCRSLIGCFGLRLSEAETLEADRQRLQDLHSCPNSATSEAREVQMVPRAQTPSSGRHKHAARTA